MKMRTAPTTAELLRSMGVESPSVPAASSVDVLESFADALAHLPATREELDAIVGDARSLLLEMAALIGRSEAELSGLVNRQFERAQASLVSTADQAAARVSDLERSAAERVSGLERQTAETLSEVRSQEQVLRDRLNELDAVLIALATDDRSDTADLDALRGLVQAQVDEVTAGFARLEQKLATDLAEQKKQVDWRMRGVVSAPPTPTKIFDEGTLVGERRGLDFVSGANVELTVADNGSDRVQVTVAAPNVPQVVVHGADAGMARPTNATVVIWVGSVEPSNAIDGDIWTDTA